MWRGVTCTAGAQLCNSRLISKWSIVQRCSTFESSNCFSFSLQRTEEEEMMRRERSYRAVHEPTVVHPKAADILSSGFTVYWSVLFLWYWSVWCSLTLGLEWYDSVPLLDRVTYFFFHSLFRELPLLFHRMLCEKQPRALNNLSLENLFKV